MDEKTRTALEESIKHWENILAAPMSPESSRITVEDCALCVEFHEDMRTDDDAGCEGCPVFERTQISICEGTPVIEAYRAWRGWKYFQARDRTESMEVMEKEFRHFVREEIAFLKSLRPGDGK